MARADLSGKQPFAKGADVSWVTQMEAAGYTWSDRDGTPKDLFQILTNLGVNSIRLRVWVDPVNGWNNKADTIAKAVRAKNAGLRLMVDFHYSDIWADPGHQFKPAAWTNYPSAQIISAVYDHTYDVLNGLKSAGVDAEWVQVGNEISCGMLWPDGFTCGVTNNLTNLVSLINSGYAAVKAVNPLTRVIIHLNNGQSNYRWWFDPAVSLGVHFDVVGLSLYPATQTNWISDTTAAFANMIDVAARYGKEVIIAETGMDATAAQACQNMLVDLMNKTRSVPGNKGLGVFYWEPEAYAYWGQTAWYSNGRPTVAMDAFAFEPNRPPGSPALSISNPPATVFLNWTVPVGATAYKVKRALTSGGPCVVIGSQTATAFGDTNVLNDTSYYYVVSALNAFGESVNSSAAVGFYTTNAVAIYGFEGDLRDSSGAANDGINHAVSFLSGIVGGQAGQFNGSNAWVQIPVAIGNSNLTIALWIKTTEAGGLGQWYAGEGLVDGEVSGLQNDFGTALCGGKFAFGIGNVDTTLTSIQSVNNGAWHHVAATWSAATGAMKVYVDGLLDSSGMGPTGARTAITDSLHLGNSHNGGHYFKGTLDDVELFGRDLSATEIASLAGTALPQVPARVWGVSGTGQAELHWNRTIGAASYNVKRSTNGGATYIPLTSNLFNTIFTNVGLSNEISYFYAVSAINASGESAASAAVEVTPHGPPQIGAARMANGHQLALSIPGWASNYSVYAATNLALPNWRALTNSPESRNDLFYLTVPTTNCPQEFFRLSNP